MEAVDDARANECDAIRWILIGVALVLSVFLPFLALAKPPGNGLAARIAVFALLAFACAAASVMRLAPGRRLGRGVALAIVMALAFFAAGALHPALYTPSHPRVAGIACLSNVKQIDLGILMYSGDWDDKLPLHEAWLTGIEPYLKTQFACPIATTPYSYAINSNLPGLPMSKISAPADVVQVFEADSYDPNAEGTAEWFSPRHNGRGNIGFVDGHARTSSPTGLHWKP